MKNTEIVLTLSHSRLFGVWLVNPRVKSYTTCRGEERDGVVMILFITSLEPDTVGSMTQAVLAPWPLFTPIREWKPHLILGLVGLASALVSYEVYKFWGYHDK